LTLGAIIHIEKADVTDLESLELVVNKTACYGKINGVIHAAGIAGGGLVQLKTKEISDKVFAPKLQGTYNLAKALKRYSIDFVVFCSSVSALIGEQSQVDYCAANACLDAFAASGIFNSKYTVSINWNTWQTVGMAVETDRPDDVTFLDRGNDITPLQGQQLFMQILQDNYSQVAISTFDINAFGAMVSCNEISQDFLSISREDLNINTNYIPPNNEIEKQLAKIWQEILGIELIGIEDDFFIIGGHSLKALRLIEAIQKKLNYNVSINDIYENKTIHMLAQKFAINTDHNKKEDILFPLKIQANNLPILFMFHPVGGNVFCYQDLVNIWDLPFSVYGVQDPSISSGKIEYGTLLEMAQSYYQEIKKIQPHGPYYLLGYSFGGTIAYEIANLFKQDGEKISFLGMLDSWAIFSSIQFEENRFKLYLRQQNQGISESMVNLAWKRMQLLTTHKPSKNDIDIVLFKATNLLKEYHDITDNYNGWKEYCDGHISVYPIDANHDSILLKNHAPTIFNILKKILADFKCSKKKFFENENNQALLSAKHSNTGQIHSSLHKIMV
jgi:thioesterase domain-containing protein/acyl carrier protein